MNQTYVLREAYAPNTRKNYDRAWKKFIIFLQLQRQLQPNTQICINVPLFKSYAIWRFNISNVSGDTIGNEISGINSYLNDIDMGLNLHNFAGEPLTRLKRGIDAVYARNHPTKQRAPRKAFVNAILDPILTLIDSSTLWKRHIKACLALAKHAGLRSHNYVKNDRHWNLRIHHLKFVPNNANCTKLIVRIPYSKTNQPHHRKREIRVVRCRCGPNKACPVHLVWDIYKSRVHMPDDALFKKSDDTELTYNAISCVLAILCQVFGLEVASYTTHSLRIGGATDAHMQGLTLPQIMIKFNWKSRKTAMRYIRPNDDVEMF